MFFKLSKKAIRTIIGQVPKEIAEKMQIIDVENRSKRAPRACKVKLAGNEISMPSLPTVASI